MQAELFDLHARVEDAHWWFVARREIMRRLVRRAVPPRGRPLVVDVGCGTGANVAALADDYECVGIDTSADAVEAARRRFPAVRFLQGFAPADLGGDAGRASAFLLMDVIEHVRDDFLLFSSLVAAARPGAHFLVTVPADMALWSPHDERFGHWRRYDPARLARVWEGLPVSVRLVSHFNSRLYPLIRAARAAGRLRGRGWGREGSDLGMPPLLANSLLRSVFAGEGAVLEEAMEGRGGGYGHGVSLVALLRREEGEAEPRSRPADLAPDPWDPEAGVARDPSLARGR